MLYDEIVDDFGEIVQTLCRRRGRSPKDGDTGDRHRRAYLIVRRRVQVIVAELAASFVECLRRQGCDIAERYRVVRVIH